MIDDYDLVPEWLAPVLADPGAALLELDRLDYEASLYSFIRDGWRYIDPAPFVGNWHIGAICEHLEAVTSGEIRRLIINIPPRCMKSSIVSVGWPAWTWALRRKGPISGPGAQFLFTSYAQNLSFRDSLKCRRLIQSSWYQRLWSERFGIAEDQNAKARFETDKGGYRIATSVDGMATGDGGMAIVADDPHNAREAESDAVRKGVLTWWDETMSTRLNDPNTGAYVIVMQRLHEADLCGHILENDTNEDWAHLCLPMEYEPARHCQTFVHGHTWNDPRRVDGQLLWPDRFDAEAVSRLSKSLGSYAAAGQLQQRPAPRGGGIFKVDLWEEWPPEGEKFLPNGKPVTKLLFPKMEHTVLSADTAYTEKEENDPTGTTLWGLWRDKSGYGRLMLMYAWRERLEFHALVEKLIKTARDYRIDKLLIESKASGISVCQEIRRLCGLEDFSVELMPVQGDKVARAYSVQHILENSMVYAPQRKWSDMVISEMASFPKTEHDDLTDSATQAWKYFRERGMLQFTREQDADLRDRFGPPGHQEPMYDS